MDIAFLFLIGGMLVTIGFHAAVIYCIFAFVFHMEDDVLTRILLAVFLGVVAGVFARAFYPLAQPVITAIISSIVLLHSFKLNAFQRSLVIGLNIVLSLIPPLIHAWNV